MVSKALSLRSVLPVGLERELQLQALRSTHPLIEQVESLSNELQDRNQELHDLQVELGSKARELKLLQGDLDVAQRAGVQGKAERLADELAAAKRFAYFSLVSHR